MDKSFKKDFFKGSITSSIGSIISIVFHFFSIMIITRSLNKEEFGVYILIIATMYLFNLLAGFGFEISLTKFISSDTEEKKGQILATTVFSRLIPLLTIILLFLIAGNYLVSLIDTNLINFTFYIPLLISLASFRDLLNNLMQGMKLFSQFVTVQVSSAFVRLIIILMLIYFHVLDIQNLLLVELISIGIALAIQVIVIRFKEFLPFRPELAVFKSLVKFSFPLYLNSILTFVYDRVNLFIISAYFTATSVAYYDVADKIPDALKRVFYSFILVYFPNSSKLFAENKNADAENLMNKSLIGISAALSVAVLVSFIFQGEIISIIFSAKYLEASLAFALLMFNFYLRAISNILGYTLVAAGFSSTSLKTNLVASSISLAGSLLMVPKFGFIGAVYALIVMNLVSQIIYTRFLWKYLFLPNSREYLKPLVVVILTVAFYYIFNISNVFLKILLVLINIGLISFWIKDISEFLNFLWKKRRIVNDK